MEFMSSFSASGQLNMSTSFDSGCSTLGTSPSWTSELSTWPYGSNMPMANQSFLPSSPTEESNFQKNIDSLYYLLQSSNRGFQSNFDFDFDSTLADTNTFNLHTLNSSSKILDAVSPRQPRKLVARSIEYYKRFGLDSGIVPVKPFEGPIFGQNRGRKVRTSPRMECVFCKNLAPNDPSIDYRSHWLKDSQNRVTCPKLRAYTCPLCKNPGGDMAHTLRYCPLKRSRIDKDIQRYVHTHQPTMQPCA